MTNNDKLAATKEINEKAKELTKKTVTIVGLGSLGSALAERFTRLGIKLRLLDMGRVEEQDLATSSLFLPEELTKFKAKEAKKHLEEINPNNKVKSFHEQIKPENVFLIKSDVVIDCANNWETSLLINKQCKADKVPLVYSKIAGAEGIIHASKGFADKKMQPHSEKIDAIEGLLPSTVSQAEAIVLTKVLKILTGEKYSNKLLHFDSWKRSERESSL